MKIQLVFQFLTGHFHRKNVFPLEGKKKHLLELFYIGIFLGLEVWQNEPKEVIY